MLIILTGNGKGKTTCALGMGLRATGAGRKVLMIQFLKSGGSSEEKSIKSVKNFQVKSFGRSGFVLPAGELQQAKFLGKLQGAKLLSKPDFDLAKQGWEFAKQAIEKGKCDFFILDEINLALKYGLLDKKEATNFLKGAKLLSKRGVAVDIVLTGRDALEEIIEMADLATEMKEIKHPYQKGVIAREGIEF